MSQSKIGARIRELREIKHYSREALAEIAAGEKGFSAEPLSRLSRALSVSRDYIMFGGNLPGC